MPAFPRSVAAPLLLLLFGVTAACERAPASHALAIRTVNNLMVADVRVDGSMPLSFVLDTGAGASVIHTRTARTLALEFGAAGSATTGGGSVDTTRGPATVTIGSAHLGSMELLAIDLTGLREGRVRHGINQRHDADTRFCRRRGSPPPWSSSRVHASRGTDPGFRASRHRVRAVLNPSPATESGSAVGDMLVAFDDRLARDPGLEDIGRLRQPDRMLTLRIERGGTPLTIRVRTRDLLPADAIR